MSKYTGCVRVAAVQAAPVSFDLQASMSKLKKLTEKAAQGGADLVVFPWVHILLTEARSPTHLNIFSTDMDNWT